MSSPPLLTAHLFLSEASAAAGADAGAQSPLATLTARLQERDVATIVHAQSDDPRPAVGEGPAVFVSIGGDPAHFVRLYGMPLAARRRWLHFAAADDVQAGALFQCWVAATDPLPEARPLPPYTLSETPRVSVFTAAYRSGARIQRPYRSLLAQTYAHWEWVIVDDSGDEGQTFREWISPLKDARINAHCAPQRSGYIGTVKRMAAERCTGEILVELDHDDALTPDALQRLVEAFRRHPECGVAYGEAAEVYEQSLQPHYYGWDAGFGFLTYWRQYDRVTDRLQNVPRTAGTNWRTVRHLVGLPNHPRAWTREAYFGVGGHRSGLSVADDYDLLVRSILCTRLLRVPHLLYLQYRNAGGGNQTFERNRQIQTLCSELERYYRPRLDARLQALGLPSLAGLPYRRIWTCADDDPRWVSGEIRDVDDPQKVSCLFVYPHAASPPDTSRLLDVLNRCAAREWRGCEVVAVGRVPEGVLEAAARRAPPGNVRWWTTEADWPAADIARYGRLLCTGPDVEELGIDTFATAGAAPAARLPLQYTDAYALTAAADRTRDRLSVLLHLRQRYGYRRYLEIGCDRDEVFAQMNGFDLKVGVDPRSGGTHRMTSDDYFAANRLRPEAERDRFDLVLIDGLHEQSQVLRDVENALECLLPGGAIVLHDCMPFTELQQRQPRPMPLSFWSGDVWKAVFTLRRRDDLDIAVGRFDWGVGVVRARPNSRPFAGLPGVPARWSWEQYVAHRDEGLNAMGYDALLQWIEAPERTAPAAVPPTAQVAPVAGTKTIELDAMRQQRFVIATPCYGGQVTTAYLHSLLALMNYAAREGLTIGLETITNESLVTRARNNLVATFMKKGFTHLVFIDADIEFSVDDFMRLYAADRDVVVGAYPKKIVEWEQVRRHALDHPGCDTQALALAGADYAINFIFADPAARSFEVVDGLVRVLDAGTGFMMIRRPVIEKLMAAHPELKFVSDHAGDDPDQAPYRYALFDTLVEPGTRRYLSEDYTFCRRWQALGGEVWLDPQIALGHHGNMTFRGNPARFFTPR